MKHKIHPKVNPLNFFKKLSSKEKQVCFLHSHTQDGWQSMIGWRPAAIYIHKNGSSKKRLQDFIQKHNKLGMKLVGYVAYDFGCEFYGLKHKMLNRGINAEKRGIKELNLPDIYVLAYDNYLIFKKDSIEVHYANKKFILEVQDVLSRESFVSRQTPPYQGGNALTPVITEKEYANAYNKIMKYIEAGDVYQINLTYRLKGNTTLGARALFEKVIAHNRVDFLAYIEGDGFEILSASPERFIKIKKSKIETCPIKGTRPRGKTKLIDKKNRQELLNSAKEAAELNMITDLLRNDLGKVCRIGSVKVEKQRALSACPTVWHTYSKIVGILKKEISPVDALLSMSPGGSVTGCPKKRAMEIIDELESRKRGIYTGAIFTIDPDGTLDSSIVIRTIIKKRSDIYLDVGGGIVYDSKESAEFQETLAKARSFLEIC